MLNSLKEQRIDTATTAICRNLKARKVPPGRIAVLQQTISRLKTGFKENEGHSTESDMTLLADTAAAHPDLAHHVLAATPYVRDMSELINARDPLRPVFKTDVSADDLLPLSMLRNAIPESFASQLFVSIHALSHTLSGSVRNLPASSVLSKRVSFCVLSANSMKTVSEQTLKGTLAWNDNVFFDRLEEAGHDDCDGRTVYNLNWMADIVHFFIPPELRYRGLGSILYAHYLEPYLRSRGFAIACIRGTCLDSEDVTVFWRHQGFSERLHINTATKDSKRTYNYAAFKRI